jgi:hypothetical protein
MDAPRRLVGTEPSPRSDHVLVADPPADRMIFFGGRDLNNFYNDLWQFDLPSGQWSPLVAAGARLRRGTG